MLIYLENRNPICYKYLTYPFNTYIQMQKNYLRFSTLQLCPIYPPKQSYIKFYFENGTINNCTVYKVWLTGDWINILILLHIHNYIILCQEINATNHGITTVDIFDLVVIP